MKNYITSPITVRAPSHLAILDEEPFKFTLKGIEKLMSWERPGSAAFNKLAKWAARVRKSLQKTEAYNLCYIIKWCMLARPRWRIQVLADLGGEDALQKWETRQMRAWAQTDRPECDEPSKPTRASEPAALLKPVSGMSANASKPRLGIQTDSSGFFRLAPILRPSIMIDREAIDLFDRLADFPLSEPTHIKLEPILSDQDPEADIAIFDLARMNPIPLLPEELRGERIEVTLENKPDSDLNFEHGLVKYGCPALKPKSLKRKPLKPKPKKQARLRKTLAPGYSYAMANIPTEALPEKIPP